MSKRSLFTHITPLPAHVTRKTAIEWLHNHKEMIELNPLVIRYNRCDPTESAPIEEHECQWYEVTDQITYIPGGIWKSEVAYKAAFHNLPVGLQTHVYAPAGLDLREKWTVCGTMPGEPREPVEMGAELPREGLFIREEVDMRCNIFLTGFVKKNLNKAHKVVVDRIVAMAAAEPTTTNTATSTTTTSIVNAATTTPLSSDQGTLPQNGKSPSSLGQATHPTSTSGASTHQHYYHSEEELPAWERSDAKAAAHGELAACQCPDGHLPTCAMYVDPTNGRYAEFAVDASEALATARKSTTTATTTRTTTATRIPYEQFSYVRLPTTEDEKKRINDAQLFSGNFHPLSHYHLLLGNMDDDAFTVPSNELALVQAELPATSSAVVTS